MRERGFTLIEMIIVILIVTILASLLLWGVMSAIDAAKESSTEATIKSIAGALESYRTQFGDYPPSSLEGLKVKLPNDTNNGIESVLACLSTKKGGGPFFRPDKEDLLTNVDGDSVAKNPTEWYFGDTQLREISDNFGSSYWYIHSADYAKPKPVHLKYMAQKGAKKADVKVYQSDRLKTFAGAGKYQLVSPGRDGVLMTPDDLRSW